MQGRSKADALAGELFLPVTLIGHPYRYTGKDRETTLKTAFSR